MKEHKYVFCRWVDATSNDEWTAETEIDHACNIIETLGHFVYEDKYTITIALSYDSEAVAFANFVRIPKVCITQRRWFVP